MCFQGSTLSAPHLSILLQQIQARFPAPLFSSPQISRTSRKGRCIGCILHSLCMLRRVLTARKPVWKCMTVQEERGLRCCFQCTTPFAGRCEETCRRSCSPSCRCHSLVRGGKLCWSRNIPCR